MLAPEEGDRQESLALAEHVQGGDLSLPFRHDPMFDANCPTTVRIGPARDVAGGEYAWRARAVVRATVPPIDLTARRCERAPRETLRGAMSKRVEVLGLGNSLVDILAYADDDYLNAQDMAKGAMTLIDEDRAEALYAARVDPRVISGGSAANTIVGVASFGVSAAYIGKVKHDPLGQTFISDIRSTGVSFDTHPAEHGPATGRCFVYVTPDGERTMNTYLGASTYLSPPDVDEALAKAAKVIYLEGYMWDRPAAKSAFQKAGMLARQAGRRVALTLSDSFCVDRFRGEFIDLMRSKTVDTVFANTDEILSLYETPHFDEALDALRAENVLGVITRSEKGCVVVEGDATWRRRRSRSPSSSTPPVRATCSPQASSPASRGAPTWSPAAPRRAGRGRDHPAPRRQAQRVLEGAGDGEADRFLRSDPTLAPASGRSAKVDSHREEARHDQGPASQRLPLPRLGETRKFYEDFLGLPLANAFEISETKSGRATHVLHSFYKMDDGSSARLLRGAGHAVRVQAAARLRPAHRARSERGRPSQDVRRRQGGRDRNARRFRSSLHRTRSISATRTAT